MSSSVQNIFNINKDGLNHAINLTSEKVLSELSLFQKFINSELYDSFIYYFNIVKNDVNNDEYNKYNEKTQRIKVQLMEIVEDITELLQSYTLVIEELARFDTFIQVRAQTF